VFVILFGAVVAGLVYIASFYFPREAVMVWHLEAWTYVVVGAFWLVERVLRSLFGGTRAKLKS
jgi:hypothetical protein